METAPNGLRPLPLRAAGSVAVVAALVYLGGVLGQDDTTFLPQAMFWFLLMLAGGVVAWFADRSLEHGRQMAIGAAGVFFIIGLFSSVVLAVAFGTAAVLAAGGVAGTSRRGEDTPGNEPR